MTFQPISVKRKTKLHNERYLLFSARGLACFRRDIVAMLGVTTFALSPRLLLEDDDVQCCTESFSQNTF
jgi:hypothetical protein